MILTRGMCRARTFSVRTTTMTMNSSSSIHPSRSKLRCPPRFRCRPSSPLRPIHMKGLPYLTNPNLAGIQKSLNPCKPIECHLPVWGESLSFKNKAAPTATDAHRPKALSKDIHRLTAPLSDIHCPSPRHNLDIIPRLYPPPRAQDKRNTRKSIAAGPRCFCSKALQHV